jgi:hypothetical protein
MKLKIERSYEYRQSCLGGVCGVLLTLCAAQAGLAQQSVPQKPGATAIAAAVPPAATHAASASEAAAATQQESEEKGSAASGTPGGFGIKVHGHWKFVVHNPDGSLVSTKEFENSLITPASGDFLIASALLGQSVPTDWAIVLCPVAGTGWAAPPYTTGRMLAGTFCPGTNSPIGVLVPSFTTIAGAIFSYSNFCNPGNIINSAVCVTGMTQALTGGTTSNPGYSITLSGNFTATTGVTINSVGTYTGYCPILGGQQFSPTSASVCATTVVPRFAINQTATSPSMLVFTGTNQTQILSAGQILTITVTISFS